MTTVVRLPSSGRWAWDARGDSRAVRVSTHPQEHVINLSLWRDDLCVGTVRLLPGEAASLVAGLTDGLSQLADQPSDDALRMRAMETRLAEIESRLAEPAWRTALTATVSRVRSVGRLRAGSRAR